VERMMSVVMRLIPPSMRAAKTPIRVQA